MVDYWGKKAAASGPVDADPLGALQTWGEMAAVLSGDPRRLVEAQMRLLSDSASLFQSFLTPGSQNLPAIKDKRFASEQWSENQAFDLLRRSYLLAAKHALTLVADAEGADPKVRAKALFASKQVVDALSPSNNPLLNPDVHRAAAQGQGESLVAGLENLMRDLEKGRITQVDEGAFEIGRNLAISAGKVVWENKFLQLIQYSPTTETVYETPLVIFPAWVNKFYILDLSPKNSFVRWAVDQGLTVFMVSWANPDESFTEVTHDDYVREGYLAVAEKVRELTGAEAINAIGYCVAGTALATVLAYLAADGRPDLFRSATFLTTQIDFAEPGEIGVFVDEGVLETVTQLANGKGYVEGRYLATIFNLLRSNDLIWSYVTNNYLQGKPHQAYDLLYWNSDSTNIPAGWLCEFVRNTYIGNRLIEPGAVSVCGRPIDLRQVVTPCFVQAGKDDHIAPAASCYKFTRVLGGPVRFVLAGSGHIAGVVNAPSAQKYQHWTSDANPATLAAFMEVAVETKGSWWPEWLAWVDQFGGSRVSARTPGEQGSVIEDAPGRYVRVRA